MIASGHDPDFAGGGAFEPTVVQWGFGEYLPVPHPMENVCAAHAANAKAM